MVHALGRDGGQAKLVAGELVANPGRDRFEWIRATPLVRSPARKRIWTWLAFTWRCLCAMARHRDHFFLLTTNPPLVPWIAPLARRLFGIHYAILVYDVYPDVMVRMGMIRSGGWIDRLLRRISARSMRRADCVLTIGDAMKRTLRAHLPPGTAVDIAVIPNWADTDVIRPMPRGENPFAVEHGLVDKFVVMYSGNFGATHDVETLVDAAQLLRDLEDLRFVLIGGGTRLAEVRQYVALKALPNLLLLDWLPAQQVRHSLASADCLVVALDEAYAGISVPSKTYSCLAAGAAIIATSPPDTELTDLVRDFDCGTWVPPRSSQRLADAVRDLHDDRVRLKNCQTRARRAAEEHFSVGVCTEGYRRVLLPRPSQLAQATEPAR